MPDLEFLEEEKEFIDDVYYQLAIGNFLELLEEVCNFDYGNAPEVVRNIPLMNKLLNATMMAKNKIYAISRVLKTDIMMFDASYITISELANALFLIVEKKITCEKCILDVLISAFRAFLEPCSTYHSINEFAVIEMEMNQVEKEAA